MFEPKRHLIRVQGGREYLPVAARLIWFREDKPDWSIVTSPVDINVDKQYAIFSASILNEAGRVMSTATKFENVRGFPDYIEKAETGAVGRALAYCGFGTQFAPELEEGDRLADSPRSSSPADSAPRVARNIPRDNGRPTPPMPADAEDDDPPARSADEAKKKAEVAYHRFLVIAKARGCKTGAEARTFFNILAGRPAADTSPVGLGVIESVVAYLGDHPDSTPGTPYTADPVPAIAEEAKTEGALL